MSRLIGPSGSLVERAGPERHEARDVAQPGPGIHLGMPDDRRHEQLDAGPAFEMAREEARFLRRDHVVVGAVKEVDGRAGRRRQLRRERQIVRNGRDVRQQQGPEGGDVAGVHVAQEGGGGLGQIALHGPGAVEPRTGARLVHIRRWQRGYGYRENGEAPAGFGNWLRPCLIRDHYAELRPLLEQYRPRRPTRTRARPWPTPSTHVG
jgi:hypothetical protein